ncbi:CAP domain-containing protein [Natrialbaceae archaeon GCM10025810]|uniref:CAP domain-containing protein n=1 Tax=Halovalidus salilacus TaxID=3075124 RepID=UPI0036221FFB
MVADGTEPHPRTRPPSSEPDVENARGFDASRTSNGPSDGTAASDADSRRAAPPSANRTRDVAGVASVLRVLVFLLLCASLALATALAAPFVIDGVEDVDDLGDLRGVDDRPSPSEEPPVAGDRDPERTDPDDPGETTYETDVEEVSSVTIEDFVHAEVNDRRDEHGLESLEWDGTIASVSRAHSADMAERDYFDHVNPDGEKPLDRFDDVGSYCRGYGENIAMNWLDEPVEASGGDSATEYYTAEGIAEALVDQWMNSTPHREAILEENVRGSWDRAGVGVHVTDEGRVYATQNFCDERSRGL